VDGRRYAVGIASVLAVGGAGERFRYRGEELVVTDGRELGLGVPGAPGAGNAGTVVVLGSRGGPCAVRVDQVDGIVEGALVREWPALLAGVVGPGFPGVVTGGEGTLLIVDAEALTAGERTRGRP